MHIILLNLNQIEKIIALSKLKAFADNNINMAEMEQFFFDRVENMVGKGEMLIISIFSFFHNVYKRLLSQGSWMSA